jgi:hypothetical protein
MHWRALNKSSNPDSKRIFVFISSSVLSLQKINAADHGLLPGTMSHLKGTPRSSRVVVDDRFCQIYSYLQYLRLSWEAGLDGWISLAKRDRANILDIFLEQQQDCSEAQEPWMNVMNGIIQDIMDLLRPYQPAVLSRGALSPDIIQEHEDEKESTIDEERKQIIKWGGVKSPYQLLRNREYMRALHFSANFQQELRESVETLLHRWGVRAGHIASCVMIPMEWYANPQ